MLRYVYFVSVVVNFREEGNFPLFYRYEISMPEAITNLELVLAMENLISEKLNLDNEQNLTILFYTLLRTEEDS